MCEHMQLDLSNMEIANLNMERTHRANMLQVTACEKKNEMAMERIDDVKINMYDRLEKVVEELQVQVAEYEAP